MEESNEYNPVVTKNELIEILYKNRNKDLLITKEEINNYIDKNAENKDGFEYDNHIYFFKINENKYIYINMEDEKEVLREINYILDNNLNNGKNENFLKYLKFQYYHYEVEINKSIIEEFKEYDYIKVWCQNCDYRIMNIKDIKDCMKFLKYNECEKYLTIDEQIYLRLIILLGIQHIYFDTTDYYKSRFKKEISSSIENIERYLVFIKENIKNTKNEYKYSFDKKYRYNLSIMLNNVFDKIEDVSDKSVYKMFKSISGNNVLCFPILKFVMFSYYVSEGKYNEAKVIYESNEILYKNFRNPVDYTIDSLLYDITGKFQYETKKLGYNYFKKECIKVNAVNTDYAFIQRNIKPMLEIYINYYKYFKHFKDNENANKAFEFLSFFKYDNGIEDFILKCEYDKIKEKISEIKIKDTDNIEKTENAVELIEKMITNMKMVNEIDVNDVAKNYPYINFDNFEEKEKIKSCIASGDKWLCLGNSDYSGAVIEWSKAVELAIDYKFIKKIAKYKNEIELYSKKRNREEKREFILDTKNATIGVFHAIKKYNLQDYLFNEYFSKIYIFERKIYDELCQYIVDICSTRNDSAHKGKIIDEDTATNCKDKILKANKILEILSKLEER